MVGAIVQSVPQLPDSMRQEGYYMCSSAAISISYPNVRRRNAEVSLVTLLDVILSTESPRKHAGFAFPNCSLSPCWRLSVASARLQKGQKRKHGGSSAFLSCHISCASTTSAFRCLGIHFLFGRSSVLSAEGVALQTPRPSGSTARSTFC